MFALGIAIEATESCQPASYVGASSLFCTQSSRPALMIYCRVLRCHETTLHMLLLGAGKHGGPAFTVG